MRKLQDERIEEKLALSRHKSQHQTQLIEAYEKVGQLSQQLTAGEQKQHALQKQLDANGDVMEVMTNHLDVVAQLPNLNTQLPNLNTQLRSRWLSDEPANKGAYDRFKAACTRLTLR